MSWFSDASGNTSRWVLDRQEIEESFKLDKHGGQKYLYEAEHLPLNYVEKSVLNPIENSFYEARERAMKHRKVRSSKDRAVMKRYAMTQLARQKSLHKLLTLIENDLKSIAEEIGLSGLSQEFDYPGRNSRKIASDLVANALLHIDMGLNAFEKHAVIFVSRPESDLLLPDSGVVIDRSGAANSSTYSHTFSPLWIPIAPDACIKIIRLKKFKPSEVMSNNSYELFIKSICLMVDNFVVGKQKDLEKAKLKCKERYFDRSIERITVIIDLYIIGKWDEIVFKFWNESFSHIPKDLVRSWFLFDILSPAIDRVFGLDDGWTAEMLLLSFRKDRGSQTC